MKIAMVLFKYFPFGGLQNDFRNFLELLVARGHQVTVYCRSWQDEGELDSIKGKFSIKELKVNALSNHGKNEKFYASLKKQLESNSVDVVFGFNKMPGLDLYFAADTCYASKVGNKRPISKKILPRDKHFLSYESAVFSQDAKTRILLISETEKQNFLQAYKTPENRLQMLPPGIAKAKIPPSDVKDIRKKTRESLGLVNETVFLHIASAFKTKGLDRCISALASLPEEQKKQARLLVIGGDKQQEYLQQAEKEAVAQHLIFLGSQQKVEQYLWAADALVHPARTEAAGIVLLEAVVAGLAVIVTRNCGYAVHIEQAQAGLVLSEPFDQAELNAALLTMFDKEKRVEWQQNALSYANEADLFSMHEKGVAYLEQHFSDRN